MLRLTRHLSTGRIIAIPLVAAAVLAATVAAGPAGASSGASEPFGVPTPTAVGTPNGAAAGDASTTPRAPDPVTVTLITGDKVHVVARADGKSTVTIDPADPSAAVRTQTVDDDLYVLPETALPYLAANTLDRDLFNVSLLIRNGYDDASRPATPVIVEYDGERTPNARSAPVTGTQLTATLESIGATALSAEKGVAAATWAELTAPTATARESGPGSSGRWGHGIQKIWLDGIAGTTLDQSVPQIHAPAVWAAGYDGSGTEVAVLDSGVDAAHPDLTGRIADVQSFVPDEEVTDVNGHGTHVASTIAGTGAASGGVYRGAAPGTTLDVGKVLGDDGFGQDSWIIEGMEWAAAEAPIVSMSIGSPQASDGTDPMSQAVDRISAERGTLFVVAAGNAYGGPIGSPGAADAALTVGAVDGNDVLADFASLGPRLTDGALKPDVSGPGVDITAARSKDSPGEGSYIDMSGTSMATPHVSAVAAMLLQAHPELSGEQVKDILMSTSAPLQTTAFQTGDGRVDAERSILTDISATGSAFLGYFPWPHEDDRPEARSLTYTNRGDHAVTLQLAASFADTQGTPADDVVRLSADTVTVPAKGTAAVDVTGDPRAAALGTTYSGFVTASASGAVVTRTAIGLSKEAEQYDLTISATDRGGQPMTVSATIGEGPSGAPFPVEVTGETTLRLPAGTYSVMSFADFETAPDSRAVAMLGNPKVVLDRDRSVRLDLRAARPISVDVGRKTEASVQRLDYYVDHGSGLNETYLLPVDADGMFAAPTAWSGRDAFEFDARWRLRSPALRIAIDGTVLDEIQASGAPAFPDGSHRWQSVDLGFGTPAEVEAAGSLDGKLAIITRSPDLTPYERARAAYEAGAAALLVINDRPGEFNEGTWDPDFANGPLPVAQVSGVEGARVLDAVHSGRGQASVRAAYSSPFVYDLVDAHVGRIPPALAYSPRPRELARVEAGYGSATQQLGGEYRYDFRPWTRYGVGFQQYLAFPQERVELVSVQPGTSWYQGTTLLESQWEQRDIRRTYRAGRTYQSHWYQPIIHPRLGEGYWTPNRQGDYIQVNIPAASDGEPGHVGSLGDEFRSQLIEVYDGDELVASDDLFHAASFEARPDRTVYRIVNTTQTPDSIWPLSSWTRTEWSFASQTSQQFSEVLPLIQLDYGVPTDLAGNVPAGSKVRFELDASHLADAVGAGALRHGWLQVSFDDGSTWRRVPLDGGRGHWTAKLRHPGSAGTYVSIRAGASDSAGNTVRQEVIRAYRVD